MGEYSNQYNRAMNPWVLHLRKLGLELRCPLCLELLNRPRLLPCNHIFCNACTPISTGSVSGCPLCKSQFANRDLRVIPILENIVTIYRSLDDAFSANFLKSQFVEDRVVRSGLLRECTTKEDTRAEKSEEPCQVENQPGDTCSLDLPPTSSTESNLRHKDGRNLQIQLTQGNQFSPDNTPSSNAKGSNNDSSGRDKHHSPETQSTKRKRDSESSSKEGGDSMFSGDKIHVRNSKRPMKQSMLPNSDSKEKSIAAHSSPKPILVAIKASGNKISCGFCQSSEVSEATGEILHYSKERLVDGDDVFHPNVIRVHRSCIDWAPQVYYEGDLVKNLNVELVRGSKIKCTKCGLKGAALGCYVQSCRRSYHVPCARQIPKCRWDYDDYLLLCPTHSSIKFPKEELRSCVSRSHTSHPSIAPQESSVPFDQPKTAAKWVLCGSALSSEEKFLLVRFAAEIGATVTKFWRPDVTHVIAATDQNGACTRTLKVLMGILKGVWIVRTDWVRVSMEATKPVEEELYEVNLDNHGCCNGPKTGRLRALENTPKLFDGLKFYLTGEFIQGYKEDLQNLIKVAGGSILTSKEELMAQNFDGKSGPSSRTLVVCNTDPPVGCVLDEEVWTVWQRLSKVEELASPVGARVIGHTWLLESIAAYKLQPLVSLPTTVA